MTTLEQQLYDALKAAQEHLEWIGYGDSYERECAKNDKLEEKIDSAIKAADAISYSASVNAQCDRYDEFGSDKV